MRKWVLLLGRLSSRRSKLSNFTTDQESGQTIIKGMGELHLRNPSRQNEKRI